MSKGRMMGVDFNKEKTWVGASLAYHPPIGDGSSADRHVSTGT
jgi:hypothetical protein